MTREKKMVRSIGGFQCPDNGYPMSLMFKIVGEQESYIVEPDDDADMIAHAPDNYREAVAIAKTMTDRLRFATSQEHAIRIVCKMGEYL